MKKTLLLKTMLLLCALIAGSSSVWADKLVIDFESENSAYPDWTFSKISSKQKDSGVANHGGSYFGVTSDDPASLTTVNKIAKPTQIQFYISKKSTNTTASYWKVEVSSDGTEWTQVGATQDAKSMSKGTWVEVTRDLSSYTDVYVRVYYSGSTAVRCIDDLTLTYITNTPKTVTFSDGGSLTEESAGLGVTLPVRDNPAGATFEGWSETELSSAITIVPTILTGTYKPTSNITLYPVYSYEITRYSDDWVETTTAPEEGFYVICTSSYAMKASISSNRFENADNTIEEGKLTTVPSSDCIWEIYKAEDNYYRIKNGTKYAGGTTSKNQGALISDESDDHAKWTITYETDRFVFHNYGRSNDSSDKNNAYLRNNSGSGWGTYAATYGTAPRLFKKSSGSDPINETFYISNIPATTATITLASACTDGTKYFGTFSTNRAFVVPSDLTISAVKVENGKLAIMDYATDDVVPANTGVMVSSSTAGEHIVSFSTAIGSIIDGNMLKASGDAGLEAGGMESVAPDCKFYRLTMHNGTNIGFWYGAANGAAFDIAANKAYLAVPKITAAKISGFAFDESTTGIANLNVNDNANIDANAPMYNLAGQRITKAYKGVVIVNGKKVLYK